MLIYDFGKDLTAKYIRYIRIYDDSIHLNENIHIEGKDFFYIMLQWNGDPPLDLDYIIREIRTANKAKNQAITEQRIRQWKPLIEQALTEINNLWLENLREKIRGSFQHENF